MVTKDKFIDLTTILELKIKMKELAEKAAKWEQYEYWSSPAHQGHGAG